MRHEPLGQFEVPRGTSAASSVDVTIVMPCLNETQCLPHCIANAQLALERIADQYGLTGEILIADNGSTDGSQELAVHLGARVVNVPERGYGAALIGGSKAAYGKYIMMGDADGSYDFTDGVAMIGELERGAGLCMGNRFAGGIVPGDGIFTTWSYRAGAGRAEAFLLNPRPLSANIAQSWGVVSEVVPNGRALARAKELAELYLKAPEITRRNTRAHFIQPLKERIVHDVGYGLSLEGASAAALVKTLTAKK